MWRPLVLVVASMSCSLLIGNYIRRKKYICKRCGSGNERRVPMDFNQKCENSTGLLILIRHGQSVWNRKPDQPEKVWRYAGSIDVPLSDVGILEALEAGEKLEHIPIDCIFCSDMDRARSTVSLAMSVHSSGRTPIIQNSSPLDQVTFHGVHDMDPAEFIVPVFQAPELKERNFGEFQGVPSNRHTELFGKEEIRKIRNDFGTRFPGEFGESSKDVYNRVIPYFEKYILPHVKAGRNVLVSSHGFAIRTLIKYLDKMDDTRWNDEMNIEKSDPQNCLLLAPTGVPLTYRYRNERFLKRRMSKIDRSESLSRTSAAY